MFRLGEQAQTMKTKIGLLRLTTTHATTDSVMPGQRESGSNSLWLPRLIGSTVDG